MSLKSDKEARLLPRHILWRQEYRRSRYCKHLTQPELNQRVRDVFLRLLTVTSDAKVGILSPTPEGVRWYELWTHALEEMALRFGPYPNGFTREILHSEPVPEFTGELARRACNRLEHLGASNVAIKRGELGT